MAKQEKKAVIPKKRAVKPKAKVIPKEDCKEVKLGRPAYFNSAESLQEKIDEYFLYIQGEFELVDYIDPIGTPAKAKVYSRYPEPAAITALALFLGFESRQSIYDYERDGTFSYTIKRAKLRTEAEYEKGLNSKFSTGAIFALKNFGWSDKQELDHSSSDGSMSMPTPIVFTKGAKGE